MELNGAKILFTIHTNIPVLGDFNISQTLVMTWIVMALLSGLAFWLGHNLQLEHVSKRQAVAEFVVERLEQFVHDNMGFHFNQYIPLVGAIFALSVGCNLISVLGFWSPTADLNTELAWAVVVFILITYHKIKSSGILGYLKGYLDPIFLMAPINVISELAHPVRYRHLHPAVLGPGQPEPCGVRRPAGHPGPDPAVPDRHPGHHRPVFRLVRRLHSGIHLLYPDHHLHQTGRRGGLSFPRRLPPPPHTSF